MRIERINKEKTNPVELREVIAGPEDAKFIEELQAKTRTDSLKDVNGEPVFAADSLEFILSIINSRRGVVALYFNGDDFVGFFELTCPDDSHELEDEYHLSNYLPNADIENMGVAESFVVMPKYRGNHLQTQMFSRMEEMAEERGITSLIGTVHPENIYSCNSFDAAGYNTVVLFESHGGPRYLKYKEVQKLEKDSNFKRV